MTYETPKALRTALEQRLLTRSQATGISLDRLRRRVLFERIVARLQAAEPGLWVIKGGMALEVDRKNADCQPRRASTASDSDCRTCTESSQPMHASVMLWP